MRIHSDSPNTRRFNWLWLLLALALGFFVSGRWTVAIVSWIVPVLHLRVMHTEKSLWKALGLVYVVVAIPTLVGWYGLQPMPMPDYAIVMGLTVLFAMLPLVLDRVLTARLTRNGSAPFIATLIFPLASTALEFISLSGSPMGTFGAQAYTQYGLPVVTQLVSITGMWGVTFIVAWFASVVNWAWAHDFNVKQIRTGVIVHGAVLVLVLGYGAGRLLLAPQPDETVEVASVTAVEMHFAELMPMAERDTEAFRAITTGVHATYLERSRELAASGAKIILWPEGAGAGVAADVDTLIAAGADIAMEYDAYLAMPVVYLFPGEDRIAENRLIVVDPAGEVVLNHIKYGGNQFEGTLPGDGVLQVADTPYGRISGVICWDSDFASTVQQAGQQHVDILLSPALDWPEIDPLHGQMSAMRAIENGVTVIRQADQGYSLVSDPYGRKIADASYMPGGETVMRVAVPTRGVPTIFGQAGDLFALLSLVGLLAVSAWAIVAGFVVKRRELTGEPA